MTATPCQGVRRKSSFLKGAGRGPGSCFPVDRLGGQKHMNEEMKQSPLPRYWVTRFHPPLLLEAKEGGSGQTTASPRKVLRLGLNYPLGRQSFNRIMRRPLIDLPKQRKLNARQCLYKTSKVEWETSHRLQGQKEMRILSSALLRVAGCGEGKEGGAGCTPGWATHWPVSLSKHVT